ncbi:unnamed protein product [Dovyalis caffra]|uniref:Cytochrome P450 n=1 Tax=Dovyalis caffra TaxID=77055 RepID=A0AAV1RX43_9ROSI|nr:unnamed protein product [Dovyalis caffra]
MASRSSIPPPNLLHIFDTLSSLVEAILPSDHSYLPFGGGPRKCVGDIFASFEAVVAVAMLVRRFNFQVALGAPPVGMTTGATIHTTEGLKMTVTRRTRPPIMPKLEKTVFEVDKSASVPEGDTQLGPKSEVYPARS